MIWHDVYMGKPRFHVDIMELDWTADFEDPANYRCIFCGTPVRGDAELEECPIRIELQDNMEPQIVRLSGIMVGPPN